MKVRKPKFYTYIGPNGESLTENTRLTVKDIQTLVDRHIKEINHFAILEQYYEGKNKKIWERITTTKEEKEAGIIKPNNKIPHSFAYYVTTIVTGYFMGEAIKYEFPELYSIVMEKIFNFNDEAACNNSLAKSCSKFGIAVEQLWMDEKANIRFTPVDPAQIIYVVDNTVAEDLWCVVKHWQEEDFTDGQIYTYVQVYYNDHYEEFCYPNATMIVQGEPTIYEHPFNDVPFIIYENNDELIGDYERVIPLIDAYDQAQSDTANDMEYFTDAFLMVKGVTIDTEEAIRMKKLRIFNFPDNAGDMKYITKDINDTATENYKDRLYDDMFLFSLIPNLSDTAFSGNSSGVAIKYKFQGLEQLCSVKETKFKKGLLRRIELINNVLNLKSSEPVDLISDTKIIFNRNTVDNLTELVERVNNLSGIISREGQIEMLKDLVDIEEEKKRVEESQPFPDSKNPNDFYNKDDHENDKPDEKENQEEDDKK